MKKGILSLFIVFFLVLAVGCGSSTKSDAPANQQPAEAPKAVDTSKLPNVYKDKDFGFSFHYPKDWEQVGDDPDIQIMLRAPIENGNISFMGVVTDSAEPNLLRMSPKMLERQYKQLYNNFKLISAEKGKFAGEDCWILSFTATVDNKKLRLMNYLFNHGKNGYNITFGTLETSFAKYDDIFKDIASSFVFN